MTNICKNCEFYKKQHFWSRSRIRHSCHREEENTPRDKVTGEKLSSYPVYNCERERYTNDKNHCGFGGQFYKERYIPF